MKSQNTLAYVRQSAAAGLLAGALVGLGEVVLMAALGGNASTLHASLWAAVVYGLSGLVAGIALGIILAWLPRTVKRSSAYAFTWTAIFAVLGLFITRYRLYRDLFHEGIRTFSVQGLLFNGGLLVVFALLSVLLWWLWQRPAMRPLAGVWGSGAASGLL
ncbi:MAG: hypothetical protein PVH17_06885, partial [Anaerolineae bacterium]